MCLHVIVSSIVCVSACVGQRGKGKSAEQRGFQNCKVLVDVLLCFLGVKMRKMCKKKFKDVLFMKMRACMCLSCW